MMGNSLGRYEIQSEIGQGGMASVYLAYDPRFRRQVAIKVLSSEFLANPILRARFEREARLIATIEHPAIVPVYDFGEQDDLLYLVMRFMSGGPLSSKLRAGPVPLPTAIQIIAQLIPALDIVHSRGVVHRDLKPGNILFDGFGNPALSDFGIAYFSEATVQLTGNAVIGTPAYMSPEQVQGNVELDGRSDLYALGIILYEMLSGRQPFRSTTPMSTALKHLSEPPPKLCINRPDLPSELDGILAKALAKDRERRYQTASDLVFDLRALPEASAAKRTFQPGWQEPSGPDAPTQPETNFAADREVEAKFEASQPPRENPNPKHLAETPPEGVSASPDTISRMPAPHPGGPVAAPPLASAARAQTNPWGGISRRTGIFALGFSGIALVGLCVLLVLGGLIYRFVLLPGASAASPIPSPAAVSSPTAPSLPPAAAPPLFSDDFSQPANGWPNLAVEGAGYSYQDGAYRITVQSSDALFWATPDDSFTDASLSVSTTLVAGSEESYYGLICRLQGQQNFYYLVIRVDGHYTIGKYQNGQYLSLLAGGWITSEAIRSGMAQNQLQADCAGDQLRFYANGELLAEVRDASLTEGKPGLAAAAIGSGELDVRFDNFLVTQP